MARTAAPPNPETVSVAQAADREGVDPKTIRRWIADGIIPAHRVGPKLIRIRVSDLDALHRRIPTTGGGQRAS